MILPQKIKIGAHSIEIRKVKSDVLSNPGHYNQWYHLIKINTDDVKEDIQAAALLHEIFEAIGNIYNLGLDHKNLTVLKLLFQKRSSTKMIFT